jgi:hypothetical protein
MFAKTAKYNAKYQVVSVRQAAPGPVALAHSNDNTVIARTAGAPRRTRRTNLVCRWHPTIGGGLECHWDIEAADGPATEGPDQRCISVHGRLRPTLSRGARASRPPRSGESVGRGLATGRLAAPAAG